MSSSKQQLAKIRIEGGQAPARVVERPERAAAEMKCPST
jgi:hypothetical protein